MGVLYKLDADYSAITEAGALVPDVSLPELTRGLILRAALSGKMSKPEGPATAQFKVAISPANWTPSHAYLVDDRVTNGDQVYVCTAAGTSDSSGGPTGAGSDITDSGVTWDHVGPVPVVLDTYDVTLDEAEHVETAWRLDFALHVRQSRDIGTIFHDWQYTVVAVGELASRIIPTTTRLPVVWPHAGVVDGNSANQLHLLYTPELETMSITCMTYVLEAL